jgi:uncharacterized membrane protein (DUF106 family)
MDNKDKEGSFIILFLVMIGSLILASLWESVPTIKQYVGYVLDPSAGVLLNWNYTWGMLIIIIIISLITTLVQKYGTDQETLKQMKKEQKELNKEMQKYKEHPEKLLEFQKKQLEFMPKMMKLSMRPIIFTAVPFILLFRWFYDFFATTGNVKFFGLLSWFWFYLIMTLIFSSVFRKVFDVA